MCYSKKIRALYDNYLEFADRTQEKSSPIAKNSCKTGRIHFCNITVLAIIIKGSKLDAFSSYAIVYCYLEFKLSYLKNLKLFSIRVKELFKPIVF